MTEMKMKMGRFESSHYEGGPLWGIVVVVLWFDPTPEVDVRSSRREDE